MGILRSPSGLRDFLNQQASQRMRLMHQIACVYQSFGFLPLETPAFESLDLLIGGGGGQENEKLIFKILKRGAKLDEAFEKSFKMKDVSSLSEYGLRFDLTLPLSRVVSGYRSEISFPWKVFHQGPVWRADRPQKGRYREFIQCDVDIIGSRSIAAETEVIQAVVSALDQVGAKGFELRLNDRRLLQAVGNHFGFQGKKREAFLILLDKKDKMEWAALIASLEELLGHCVSFELIEFLKGEGGWKLDSFASYDLKATEDLMGLCESLRMLDLPLERVVFDPCLARGMGYYTGPIFELRHASAGYSFGGGGRYDSLISRGKGEEIAACGFSLGFERLALLLAEQESQGKTFSKTIFVPIFEESLRNAISSFIARLRLKALQVSQMLVIDLYPDQAKVKTQFKFASTKGYRWVLIIGVEEWRTKQFKLKDFKNGIEINVQAEAVLDMLLGLKD